MNNAFLQDTNLSLQAKGLLAEILSNKDDWRIYISELAKRSTNGRDAHKAAYKELQDAGYIRVVRFSRGYKKGVENYVFAQDIPIKDSHLDYFKQILDRELSKGKGNSTY